MLAYLLYYTSIAQFVPRKGFGKLNAIKTRRSIQCFMLQQITQRLSEELLNIMDTLTT